MDLRTYRQSRQLSLDDAATALGVESKGYLSRLETGDAPMSIKRALEIEVWSQGEVRAVEILPGLEAELLRRAIARGLPVPAEAEA